MPFEFVSYFGFRASSFFSPFLASFAPLRLAPWNNTVNEKITLLWKGYSTGFASWNTDSTKIELFARSAIPQGESSFIRFPKPKFNVKFQICLVRILLWGLPSFLWALRNKETGGGPWRKQLDFLETGVVPCCIAAHCRCIASFRLQCDFPCRRARPVAPESFDWT